MENTTSIIEEAKDFLSKRIPYEKSHQKTHFFFDSKTILPNSSFKENETQKLISYFTKKLNESKNEFELSKNYHLRACVFFDNLQYEQSLFDYLEAEKYDSKNPILFYDLSCVYQTNNEIEKSQYYAEKALELYPNYTQAIDILAHCHKKNNNRSKAISLLEKCLKIDQQYIPAFLALSRIYKDIGNENHDKKYFQLEYKCYHHIHEISKEIDIKIYRSSFCIAMNRCINIEKEYISGSILFEKMNKCVEIYPGN